MVIAFDKYLYSNAGKLKLSRWRKQWRCRYAKIRFCSDLSAEHARNKAPSLVARALGNEAFHFFHFRTFFGTGLAPIPEPFQVPKLGPIVGPVFGILLFQLYVFTLIKVAPLLAPIPSETNAAFSFFFGTRPSLSFCETRLPIGT